MSSFQEDDLNEIQRRLEKDAESIDEVVNDIIGPYSGPLDKYVEFIQDCLRDGERQPTDVELEDFCLNLSTLIYAASGLCERLGIRDDIGKSIYKETYHTARASQSNGTIADKNSLAELAAQREQLVSICYTRSYKIVKAKVESAQELLTSCKKAVSRRMQEMELTHISNN